MSTSSSYEPKEGSLSFFKVVRYPSSPHLALPKVFVERYLDKIPKNPILTTSTGEHSWNLKITKIGEDYCFSSGWDKLVKDAHLCVRDIVVFWLIDPCTFLISFLNENGCEKDLPIDNTNDVGANVRNHADDKAVRDDYVVFQKQMPRNKYSWILPKKFVRDARLGNKTSITIKDFEGHEWQIGILIERDGIRHLSSGWLLCRKHHHISEGDICSFKFSKKEGVLYLTEVIKSKRPVNKESSTEGTPKRRERQPRPLGVRDVKIEDECSPIEKHDGFVKVKTEYESGPEVEGEKRKTGKLPLKGSCDDGGGLKVKTEDEAFAEVAVGKRKKGGPSLEKPGDIGGSVEVQVKPGIERLVRNMGVVYF
uniref:B3 domain-containing protein REM5-like n=1 Tax=Erigeron canadensis TaxID=72917 RepID=UPI001CB98564|nr:B3 domain-containing protein REM5-like [Erigeron canadensis]